MFQSQLQLIFPFSAISPLFLQAQLQGLVNAHMVQRGWHTPAQPFLNSLPVLVLPGF